MSNTLDQIDQIIKRTHCTYKEASDALQATDGDIIEAIILIENQSSVSSTGAENSRSEHSENQAHTNFNTDSNSDSEIKFEWKSQAFKAQMKFLWAQTQKIFKKLLKLKIAWQKDEKIILELPLLIVLLITWFTMPFSLIVLVLPFFLGFNVMLKNKGKKDKNIGNIIKSQFEEKS